MTIETLAESSALAWWPQHTAIPYAGLYWLEALLVLIILGLAIVLHAEWRLAHARRNRYAGIAGGCEAVRLTPEGPFVTGARARLTMHAQGSLSVVEGYFEGLDREVMAVSIPASDVPIARPGTVAEMTIPAAGAAFRCISIVRDRCRQASRLRLYLDRPVWVERVQRRGHFRVPVRLPTTVARIDDRAPSSEPHLGRIVDLSGSGVSVTVPFDAPAGAILRIRIPLPGLENASYEARVMRVHPARRPQNGMFLMGCEFLRMGEATHEAIIRACFDQEQALMLRGPMAG